MSASPQETLPELLERAGFPGPHLVYVDSTGVRNNMIVLTSDGRASKWEQDITDRERALIRTLLHLAQDRLDSTNPHD
jgi:hypothetical protein